MKGKHFAILLSVPVKRGKDEVCVCVGHWRGDTLRDQISFSCEMKKEGELTPKLTVDCVISFVHGIISQQRSPSSRCGAFFKCF